MDKAKSYRPAQIKIDPAGKVDVQPARGDDLDQLRKQAPELKMVDLGNVYRVGQEAATACFRCYCGSGCLCGCVN